MQADRKRRTGMTRIDLAILLSICALLVSLLLPAVEMARETSRSYQCKSNLRQIVSALNTYHDRNGVFPPAAIWGSEGLNLPTLDSHKDPTPIHVTRQNWLQLLLPDLDQSQLAAQFDPSHRIGDDENRVARTTTVPLFNCPCDTYNKSDNPYEMPLPGGMRVPFARGNYAINGGSEYVPVSFGTLSNPGPTHSKYHFDERTREFQFSGSGIAGINESLTSRDFRNGLATTVAIEEVRSGLSKKDTRGAWALGQIGASITWGHGVLGDDGSPNATEKNMGADDIREGKILYAELGREFIDAQRMQVCDHCDENTQATARSLHASGINLAMLDGSVHFVSDHIAPSLWHVMHSRNTPADNFPNDVSVEYSGPRWKNAQLPPQTDPPKTLPSLIENSIGMKFVRIHAGEFTMGLPNTGYYGPYPKDAIPHQVRITHDFYLGVHEVTQGQFKRVLGINPSENSSQNVQKNTSGDFNTDNFPVENVTWDQAADFCRRLSELPEERAARRSYHLPTEAQWEYSCRAGIKNKIPMSSEWDMDDASGVIANKFKPKHPVSTVPVGTYPPNPFGLHDMCGNVFEWVADYRAEGYYGNSPTQDPSGPDSGYLRVIRGWHWVATGAKCKVYVANDPWVGSPFIGFRVVCNPSP